jgi:large subunit ribosomal protein L17
MRHRKAGRKFGRTPSHRKAMMRNLALALFTHLRIETTEAKAKELRRYAEKMITKAKKGSLHAIRLLERDIKDKDILYKLVHEIAPVYKDRNGGYTRVIKLRNRHGDNAPMSIIELVDMVD